MSVKPEDYATGRYPPPRKGIRCPECGSGYFRTIETRAESLGRIRRRRECNECGHRMTTFERPVSQPGQFD